MAARPARRARLPRTAARQRGQTFVIAVFVVAFALAAAIYGLARPALVSLKAEKVTQTALLHAKQALIGYAVTNSGKPGALPCPDLDNDGTADAPCGATGLTALGRLPWRTLGLPHLRDGAGECLWYAVSANFKNSGVSGPAWINSDSVGTLVVRHIAADGTESALPAPQSPAIAVVFSPGPALSGQDRTPPAGPAPACGGNNVAAHYLESSNATAGTSYVAPAVPGTVNDRLMLVSGIDVIPPVERLVAREILALLQSYRTFSDTEGRCRCYPWADADFNGTSNTGTRHGSTPLVDPLPHSWASLGIAVPAWLTDNRWWRVAYYGVSLRDTEADTGGWLSVDGVTTRVVLFTPGPAVSGDGRPSTNWCNYIDDSRNCNANDTFFTPSSGSRDRIHVIPWP